MPVVRQGDEANAAEEEHFVVAPGESWLLLILVGTVSIRLSDGWNGIDGFTSPSARLTRSSLPTRVKLTYAKSSNLFNARYVDGIGFLRWSRNTSRSTRRSSGAARRSSRRSTRQAPQGRRPPRTQSAGVGLMRRHPRPGLGSEGSVDGEIADSVAARRRAFPRRPAAARRGRLAPGPAAGAGAPLEARDRALPRGVARARVDAMAALGRGARRALGAPRGAGRDRPGALGFHATQRARAAARDDAARARGRRRHARARRRDARRPRAAAAPRSRAARNSRPTCGASSRGCAATTRSARRRRSRSCRRGRGLRRHRRLLSDRLHRGPQEHHGARARDAQRRRPDRPLRGLRTAVLAAPGTRDAQDVRRIPARDADDPGRDDQRRPAGVPQP